jgi:dATP pyrophosphohydrolase
LSAQRTSSYKRPESVLVVLYTDQGEVLMLRRREPPDFWQSVTGSLKWDEQPPAAARRELLEETGLDLPVRDCGIVNRFPILPAWRSRYAPEVESNTEHVFIAQLGDRCPIRLNPQEHGAYRWLPWREAARLASSWTNRDAILQLVGNHRVDIPD